MSVCWANYIVSCFADLVYALFVGTFFSRPAALLAAVLYFMPTFFPLLAPAELKLAHCTGFVWKVRLFHGDVTLIDKRFDYNILTQFANRASLEI